MLLNESCMVSQKQYHKPRQKYDLYYSLSLSLSGSLSSILKMLLELRIVKGNRVYLIGVFDGVTDVFCGF